QRADNEHETPRVLAKRVGPAHYEPNERSDECSESESRLQETRAFRPRAIRPAFGKQGDAGAPLATHRETGDKAQETEHPETRRERGDAREQGVEEHRIDHHPLAADVVRENTAEQAAD